MAAVGVLTTKSPIHTNNPAYPIAYRDPILSGANDGVRFLFDAAFPWCYPGGDDPFSRPAAGAPANGALVRDISEHANGSFAIGSGGSPTIAGGGFAFDAVTNASLNAYLAAPASAAADLYNSGATGSGATVTLSRTGNVVTGATVTAGGSLYTGNPKLIIYGGGGSGAVVNLAVTAGVVTGATVVAGGSGYTSDPTAVVIPNPQKYLFFGYFRLPTSGDWITDSNTVANIMEFAPYNGGADLASVGIFDQIGGSLRINHQNTVNGATLNTVGPISGKGVLNQVAIYRTDAGCRMRVRSVNGDLFSTLFTDDGTPSNYSTSIPKWGMCSFGWGAASAANARKFRLYRGGIENLNRSGRDPIAVLDADWARVQARIAASAASNSGTSLIFN